MTVKILHHGRCFDGVVSAALAIRLLQALGEDVSEPVTEGQTHRRGPPFDEGAFSADTNVVVDYRYSPDPRLTWWFDHHATTFSDDADRDHLARDRSGRRFFDPEAPSCAGLIHRVARDQLGVTLTLGDAELIAWADRIDTAQFANAAEAVGLQAPPLQLMHWLETAATAASEPTVVAALAAGQTVAELLAAPDRARELEAALATHHALAARARDRLVARDRVAWIDLGDREIAGINKFIPYDADPELDFAVMLLQLPSRVKVSVGSNPFLPSQPDIDIGALCQRFGGGGHAAVGAVSLPRDAVEEGRRIGEQIVAELRNIS